MEEFITYENYANPHITIHGPRPDGAPCKQIGKRGGKSHPTGKYQNFESYEAAHAYALTLESSKFPIKNCSFCKPHSKNSTEQEVERLRLENRNLKGALTKNEALLSELRQSLSELLKKI